MEDKIELRNGYWWPKHDYGCWNFLLKRLEVPNCISEYVADKRVLVQAGGNAGLYTKLYSGLFDRVYTFEPDHLNFICLVKNTASNVIKFQACLGNEKKFVSLTENVEYFKDKKRKKYNTGSHFISGIGNVPMLKVDDLELDRCDLIHLDIEGYEGPALEGAAKTIQKFCPVIAVELNGHGERYGWSDQNTVDLLNSYGYRQVGKIFEDVIFSHNKDNV